MLLGRHKKSSEYKKQTQVEQENLTRIAPRHISEMYKCDGEVAEPEPALKLQKIKLSANGRKNSKLNETVEKAALVSF